MDRNHVKVMKCGLFSAMKSYTERTAAKCSNYSNSKPWKHQTGKSETKLYKCSKKRDLVLRLP